MESEPMLAPRENRLYGKKSPPRRIESMTLHPAGQRAQHTTNDLSPPPPTPPPPPHLPRKEANKDGKLDSRRELRSVRLALMKVTT